MHWAGGGRGIGLHQTPGQKRGENFFSVTPWPLLICKVNVISSVPLTLFNSFNYLQPERWTRKFNFLRSCGSARPAEHCLGFPSPDRCAGVIQAVLDIIISFQTNLNNYSTGFFLRFIVSRSAAAGSVPSDRGSRKVPFFTLFTSDLPRNWSVYPFASPSTDAVAPSLPQDRRELATRKMVPHNGTKMSRGGGTIFLRHGLSFLSRSRYMFLSCGNSEL